MAATNDRDRERLKLEDILALLVRADNGLRIAATRMNNRVRTKNERADIIEIVNARADLQDALDLLAEFHPNRLRT